MTNRHTGLPEANEPESRDEAERWFVERGVPHFIEDYSATEDVLTRAAPFLALVFLISAISAIDLDWPAYGIALAGLGGLSILIGVWVLLNWWRGRPLTSLPEHIGRAEVAVYLLVPTALPLVFGGDLKGSIITFVTLLVILGFVYGVASYALVSLTVWAVKQLFRTLGQTMRLFTRGLPLLLVGFMFIFINAEAWQSAGRLDRSLLIAVASALALLAAAFLLTQIPNETRSLHLFSSWDEVERFVDDAPVVVRVPVDGGKPQHPALSRREIGNIWIVFLVSEGLRLLLVSLLVGALFVGLGLLIIRPETIELWTQQPPDVLWSFTLGDTLFPFTRELLQVATFLAAFAAVYFSVYAATDPTLRAEFFEATKAEVRQNLAVRLVYRAHQ